MSLKRPSAAAEGPADSSYLRLLHDLQTHQVELEAQNEELRRMQVELQDAKNGYFELWEDAPVAYVTIDLSGKILAANQRTSELVGVDRARMVGKPFPLFLTAACANPFHLFKRLVISTGLKQSMTAEVHRPDGEERHVRIDAVSPRDGESCRMIVHDVTALLRAEARIARLNTELAQRVNDLSMLSGRMIELQEAERGRIARDLHDDTGQALSALVAELRALEDSTSDQEATARAKRCRQRAATALRDVRRLAQGLHPTFLEGVGLGAAIERCAADLGEAHGFKVNTDVACLDQAPLLSATVQMALFRVVQEALTNIARHAHATRAAIFALRQGASVRLIIEDDGRGFDTAAVLDRKSGQNALGLLGMRERMSLIQGTVVIESAPGKSTTIAVEIPGVGESD